MPTGRGAVSQGDPTIRRDSGSHCPSGLQQLHSGSPDNCCQQQECYRICPPNSSGDTGPPWGTRTCWAGSQEEGVLPVTETTVGRRPRRPCAWCGAGAQRTCDCTARARWSSPGWHEGQCDTCRCHTGSERGCVKCQWQRPGFTWTAGQLPGPRCPRARPVLSLTVTAMAARGCCLQEGEKRGALSTSGLQTHPLSPSLCPHAGDGHGRGPESSRSPCPCQRFPWSDCTLPAIPS